MLATEVAGFPMLVKPEWFNPTASFKDRGTTVMMSLLRDRGVTEVLEDSSGNGGAAVSAAGDVVTYGGASYRCLQPHTAIPGWEPPNVPALWQRV